MDTFFAGEIATEVVKELITVIRRTYLCRSIAEQLKRSVDSLLPIVQEIRLSGVELPQPRHTQLSDLAAHLRLALDLARAAAASPRWNVYRSMQLARRMEKVDRWISRWVTRQMPAHVLADVHHLRVDSEARLERLEKRVEEVVAVGAVAPVASAVAPVVGVVESGKGVAVMMEGLEIGMEEVIGVGFRVGKERVKEMVMEGGGGGWKVVGISGIGGSGKTTLAKEICRDEQIRSMDSISFLI